MKPKTALLASFLLFSLLLKAEIKVASILKDNMVLQRNTEVNIWGVAGQNQQLLISTSWNDTNIKTRANNHGKWMVTVKTGDAGGPYVIRINSGKERVVINNILLGEVWLCSGQSNMHMYTQGGNDQPVNGANEALVNAANDNIRLFTVGLAATPEPQDTCNGVWKVANAQSVGTFSAVGYFFAREIQRILKVPVGIIASSWGSTPIETWVIPEEMAKFPDHLKKTMNSQLEFRRKSSHTYNGMINPIKNYAIKGVLWYQGEANRLDPEHYPALMKGLVEGWRAKFMNKNMPLYFVEIAPYSYGNSDDVVSARFRAAQLEASLLIPNCGMVSTIDIGDENFIHPPEKETVGKRLSLWALAETYGMKGFSYKTPYCAKIVLRDSVLVVSFEHAEWGLTSFGKELTDFYLAGEDKLFHPAKAYIENKQVVVHSSEVKKPVAVRYRYTNYPKGDGYLYNTAGLPVSSFRSDDWNL